MQGYYKIQWDKNVPFQFLKRLNIELPQNPAILLPDTDPREMKIHVHTKPCTQLFITGLFTLAKKKEATQMSIDCWMDNIKYDQVLFSNKKWVNLNTIRLSGRSQRKRSHIVPFLSYGMSWNGKPIETEIRLVVRSLGGGAASLAPHPLPTARPRRLS